MSVELGLPSAHGRSQAGPGYPIHRCRRQSGTGLVGPVRATTTRIRRWREDPVGSTLFGMSAGAWIAIVVVAGVAIAVVLLLRRQRQEASLKEWIADQPVLFATRALVRIRASGAEGFGWRTLNSRGGARLVIHGGGIEVTIGRGDGFISGNLMRASDATMWRDRIGWGGSFVRKRDCIRLHGFNGRIASEWAVTPWEASLDEVWQALLAVGVTPGDGVTGPNSP